MYPCLYSPSHFNVHSAVHTDTIGHTFCLDRIPEEKRDAEKIVKPQKNDSHLEATRNILLAACRKRIKICRRTIQKDSAVSMSLEQRPIILVSY